MAPCIGTCSLLSPLVFTACNLTAVCRWLQVIYVVNRHALRFDEFHVRRARPEDMKDVRRLVHDLPNAASIQASFFR